MRPARLRPGRLISAYFRGSPLAAAPGPRGEITNQRRLTARGLDVKFTGLAQILGQLSASNRDLQSNCWANLIILGQPCDFLLLAELPLPRAQQAAQLLLSGPAGAVKRP